MQEKERATSALIAAFPTSESFHQFSTLSENSKALQSFCIFAFTHDIIENSTASALENFIQAHSICEEDCIPPPNLDFESFLDQKEDLLNLKLSMRALTDRINMFVDKKQMDLPKVSNSMISRLKKEAIDTVHKQNVLRCLSFWLGYVRAHQPHQWNYEMLCRLCIKGKPHADHKEGVRIGFALFSRGEVIDYETVKWLKRLLKNYIEQSLKHFSYGRWGKVRAHDITTLYVDFPKETAINTPESYRHCLRGALSLCHQICIRWTLSKHFSPNRFLSIGITAGGYSIVDKHLLPILNAKLPTDPVIRLTDYARQCVLINDIRVISCAQPKETTLYNGETLSIWWIMGFWSTLYFDFIPDLIADEILSDNSEAVTHLANNLWILPSKEKKNEPPPQSNAITSFFKFPQNSLLGLEISKTLYFRRRFWEAIEILRIMLSLDPTNIIARTLRMMILSDLSLNAPTYGISESLFAKAHNEARFIQQNCPVQTEDFYCAHALVYLAQAMLTLRYLRKGNGHIEGESPLTHIKSKIFDYLHQSDALFGMGDMVSSTGIRSYYLQKCVKVIITVLMNDDTLFTNPGQPIDGSLETVRKPTREFKWHFGHFKDSTLIYPPGKLKARIFRRDFISHEAAIVLQAHRPSFYFCSAVAWWDFLPVRTVANAKVALQLLDKAKTIAEALQKENICTFSLTQTFGEMMPAKTFIAHMNTSIRMIREEAGEGLYRRSDDDVIGPKDSNKMSLLLTLNF